MTELITPASLRAHADWMVGAGHDRSGQLMRKEADRLEAESARDEYVEQLAHVAADSIAKLYRSAIPRAEFFAWDALTEIGKEARIVGIRAVLDRLAADGRLLPEGGRDQHDDRHVDQDGPQVQNIGFYRTMEPDFATEHFDFPAPGSLNHTATDGSKWVWDESMSQWEMREHPPTAPDGTRPWRTAADVPDGVWFTSARLDDCKYRWLRCGKNSTDYADMADPKPAAPGFQVWDASAVNDFAPFVSVVGAP